MTQTLVVVLIMKIINYNFLFFAVSSCGVSVTIEDSYFVGQFLLNIFSRQ
jgi:hypothetical protein